MNRLFLTAFVALLISCKVMASGAFIEIATGFASESSNNYDEAGVVDASFGYQFSLMTLKGGVLNFSEFQNEDNSNFAIDVNALYLGAAKNWSFKAVQLEAGAGLTIDRSVAELQGDEIEKESGVSPYLSATFIVPLAGATSLFAQYKYINDVAGTDLSLYQAGARFKF